MLPWPRSLSCLQLQRVLGVSHRFLTLVLDSRYHRLNSIPPEISMASPPMNSALAVGPDCSWISWSHGKTQVTNCTPPERFLYSLWYCPHTTCHFAGRKRNRGIFWKDGQNILMDLPPSKMGWSYSKAPCILPLSPVCHLAQFLHRVSLQAIFVSKSYHTSPMDAVMAVQLNQIKLFAGSPAQCDFSTPEQTCTGSRMLPLV